MITGLRWRRIAALGLAVAALSGGLSVPAQAAAGGATVAVTPTNATPAVGCLRVPVTITVTGARYWNAFIDSAQAMSDIHMHGDRPVQSDAIIHCPYRDGVGTFAVKGSVSLYDAQYHYLGKRAFASRYTVVKSKPQVGIAIRSGAPKVDEPVRLRMCTALTGVRLFKQPITLNIVPAGGTAQSFTFTTDRNGCAVYVGYFTRATVAKVSFSTDVTSNLVSGTTPPLTLDVKAA